MDTMKLAGIKKGYEKTDTVFTKKGMWPDRYESEVRGILLASKSNISVPNIIRSSLDKFGGQISMNYIHSPRLDQVLWGNPNPAIFEEVGKILAKIHAISTDEGMSISLVNRRFYDLKNDLLSRGDLPPHVMDMSIKIFDTLCSRIVLHDPCLIHGDYTIQNIFSGDSLIVFDWEHSCYCSPVYDIGTALSFMILLVTDGGWKFTDYFNACDYFLSGYESISKLDEDNKIEIDILRFIGHRQIPQFYLFILEYFAILENNQLCMSILKGDIKPNESYNALLDIGLHFDFNWCNKLFRSLKVGDYRFSDSLWDWYKMEIIK